MRSAAMRAKVKESATVATSVTPDAKTNANTKAKTDAPMKGSEHGKAHRFDWHTLIEVVAFLVGLGIFLYPLIASYVNYSQQSRAIDNYDAIVNRLSPAEREKMWRDAKEYDVELGRPHLRDPFSTSSLRAPLNRYWKTLDVDGHGMMAYVEIPKIHVELPVYHGTSDAVLAKGTGHIATTHLPTNNRTIHSVITGHTGLVGHIFFDNLTQMKKGDTFQIRVLTHRLTYRVDSITVIWPTQVQALQPVQGKNYVTLLTCTPYGVNDHRLLVRGRYIGEAKPMTQPHGLPRWFLWLFLLMTLLCVLAEMLCRRRRNKDKRLLADDEPRATNPTTANPTAGVVPAQVDVAVAQADTSARAGNSSNHADSKASKAGGSTGGDANDGRLNKRHLRRQMRWLEFGIWVFSLAALFFAWASFAMMMRTGFLPAFDLGYSWFDTHIAPWFGITGMKSLSMPLNSPITF